MRLAYLYCLLLLCACSPGKPDTKHSAQSEKDSGKSAHSPVILREDSTIIFSGHKILARDTNSEMYVAQCSLNFKKDGEWIGIQFGSEDICNMYSIENVSIERVNLDKTGADEVIIKYSYSFGGVGSFRNYKALSILSTDSVEELFNAVYYADSYVSDRYDKNEPVNETAWVDIAFHPGWISVGRTNYTVDHADEHAIGLEYIGISALKRGKYVLKNGRFVWNGN